MKSRTELCMEPKVEALNKELKKITKKVSTCQARVVKGIFFLDGKMAHSTWLKRIQIKKLDLSSNQNCVLGQVYTDPWKVVTRDKDKSKMTYKEAVACGFGESTTGEDYRLLTAVWYDALSALKK